jgi:hypothetical protein
LGGVVAGFAHKERRYFKRVPFTRKVEIVGIGIFPCLNLSSCGLYLEIAQDLPVGSVVDLQFKLWDTDEHPLAIQACVLYRHMGTGIGLTFIDLSLEDHEKIIKFIEEI